MEINLYIAELLRQHNVVHIPLFGTFFTDHKAGYYNPENNEFFPPSYTVSFKDQEDESTLLAEYISTQKHVSISTALYFIDKFVSYTKSLINFNGQAEIESIGILKKTSDGYILTNTVNLDLNGQYYGLTPAKDLKIDMIEDVKPFIPIQETEDIPLKEETVDEPEEEQLIANRSRVSTSSMVLLFAAFLIIAGIISYLTFPEAFESFNQKTGVPEQIVPVKRPVVAAVPMSLEDSLTQADTIYQELAKQGFEIEKPRDTLQVTTEVKTEPALTDAISFEIIGAAFARRNEAESYVKQLQKRGVYAKIVENMPGSKLKISLGTFNDEVLAKKELIRIKADINKEAWIARVKPKETK